MSKEIYIKEMFGRPKRIDIWKRVVRYTIEPPEVFHAFELQSELQTEEHITKDVVRLELNRFEALGMIERQIGDDLHDDVNQRKLSYIRVASPSWKLIEVGIEVVDELYPPTEAESLVH